MNILNFRKYISRNFFLLVLCYIFSILILKLDMYLVVGALISIGIIAFIFIYPDIGTFIIIIIIYGNFAVVAIEYHNVPRVAAAAVVFLLVVPMVHYIIIDRQKLLIDTPFLLMAAFFVVLLMSSLFAKDVNISNQRIITFLQEGLVLYLLIINVIRKFVTLKRVIWVLMLTGSLLGALTLYQDLTRSYDKEFGGLARRNLQHETEDVRYKASRGGPPTKVRLAQRALGPIGDANRYAQILLLILPLACSRFWGERSRLSRVGAGVTAMLILCGILLTYSRGAFITIALLLLIMTATRYIKFYKLLISGVVLILLITVMAPGYFLRMDTMRGAQGLVSDEADAEPDAVTRGRVTEMLAALTVFLDYPILGVGPGQYTPFYSRDYQLNPDIAFRHIPRNRRAHTLYFEIAAETGIVGFAVFMAIVLVVLRQLWQARRLWSSRRPELANTAMAFFLGIISYLSTGIFLHFAYERYYWFFLALAGAALQISRSEISSRDGLQEIVQEKPDMLSHAAGWPS